MNPSTSLARRLYAAIKGLDDAHDALSAFRGEARWSDAAFRAEKEIEGAEDALSDVLCDLKQWSIEP